MTDETKKLYTASKNNKDFLAQIKRDDGSTYPSIFAPEWKKIVFASIYYGYLLWVSFGNVWRKLERKDEVIC